MAFKRISFTVHGGTVQGVFFRAHTQEHAKELGLTGWVRNAPGEKVKGEAQTDKDDAMQNFIKEIGQGPKHAHVVKVDTKQIEPVEGEMEFEVRH